MRREDRAKLGDGRRPTKSVRVERVVPTSVELRRAAIRSWREEVPPVRDEVWRQGPGAEEFTRDELAEIGRIVESLGPRLPDGEAPLGSKYGPEWYLTPDGASHYAGLSATERGAVDAAIERRSKLREEWPLFAES